MQAGNIARDLCNSGEQKKKKKKKKKTCVEGTVVRFPALKEIFSMFQTLSAMESVYLV